MRFVSYRRVSTDEQGRSGLGLDAQAATIAAYVEGVGGEIVAEFVEVMSGKDDDRPELEKAKSAAKRLKAKLVVSKLDRLSRDLAFIAQAMKTIDFVACNMPTATKAMHQMMGVFAEMERDLISERTRDALQALKAKGVKLGNPRPAASLAKGIATRKAQAETGNARVMLSITDIRASGVTTLKGIAEALNARGVKTARGGTWQATQVARVLAT